MRIAALMPDPQTGDPVVVLKEVNGARLLPLWIGMWEASAVALKLENIVPPRPMTHDILKVTVEELGASVKSVMIHDLRDDIFYALIRYEKRGGESIEIDARPSDAIALALRAECPIYAEDTVLEKVAHETKKDALQRTLPSDQEVNDWLKRQDPDKPDPIN